MRKTFILLLSVLAIGVACAQKNIITIKGKVTDSKTKGALPGVTIHVQGQQIFTQSNGDGKYVIKVPESLQGANLIFNVFGYDRDTIAVKAAAKRPDVKMKRGGAIKLSTVTVSDYTPKSLIKEALKRIPQNFWCDSTVGTFFYRDVRQVNGGIYLFDEMVFDALRVGYDKNNTIKRTNNNWRNPDARAIESNYKTILFSRLLVNDTARLNEITGGTGDRYLDYSDNEILFDPVEIPNTTLYFSSSKRKQRIWDYAMQNFTDADGVEYYFVTMTNNSTMLGQSADTVHVTVRRNDIAITRVEKIHASMLNDIPWPFSIVLKKIEVDSIGINQHDIYNYGEVDGKMTLTSFTKHSAPIYYYANGSRWGEREQRYCLDVQCVLTSQRRGDASYFDLNKIQSPVRIAVSERKTEALRYDEEFWSQYNFIPLEEHLLQKLNEKLKGSL